LLADDNENHMFMLINCWGYATFRSGPFRSGDISVRLRNFAEILHVHILMQTYLN